MALKVHFRTRATNFSKPFSDYSTRPAGFLLLPFRGLAKIKPRAFLELHQVLLNHKDKYGKLDLWKGHRVLAIDGSTFRLPPVNALRRRYHLAPNRATKSIRSRPIARTSTKSMEKRRFPN